MNLSQELLLRLVIGGLLGGIIGFEREMRSKGAGFRTHFLVALGSTLLAVISGHGYYEVVQLHPGMSYDSTRIAAQIVSGIGFIGAGLIIFQKNVIHGITTAAGLWVTAAIGIACGVGFYTHAVVATVMVLLALELLLIIDNKGNIRQIEINVSSPDKVRISQFYDAVKSDKVRIRAYDLEILSNGDGKHYKATIELSTKLKNYEDHLCDLIGDMDGTVVSHIK